MNSLANDNKTVAVPCKGTLNGKHQWGIAKKTYKQTVYLCRLCGGTKVKSTSKLVE